VLLNTHVKHSLASSEYNTRRKECEKAIALIKRHQPEVNSLRDVTEEMLDSFVLPEDKVADRRGRFVVQEIQRLLKACDDLRNRDVVSLGKKMFATHDGLSRMYDVSCKELDWLVDRVKESSEVIGARMMGGGFGGCTVNLVFENAIDELVKNLATAYQAEMKLPLTHYVASIENGTERIEF
jgi:galactokinase